MSDCNPKMPEARFLVREKIISIEYKGQRIAGTFTFPDDVCKFPVILLLHGHEGNRHEMKFAAFQENMFDRTARIFAEQGFASVRIDFLGCGESDGNWEDTLISDQIEVTLKAIDFIKKIDCWDLRNIGILGLSQGGLVAACTVGRSADVNAVVLWSPVSNPQYTYANYIYGMPDTLRAINEAEPNLIIESQTCRPVKARFLQEIFQINPPAEICSYNGPLQVTIGLDDEVVNPQPIAGRIYLKYHTGEHEIIELADTDHMLNVDKSDHSACDQAILSAIGFFRNVF